MRYLEQLIDRARELSQNTRYDANSGVSQKMFVQFFQNAQDFITREVVSSKSKYFIKPTLVSVVSGQEEYAYPSDIILQGIDTIEWSQDSQSWMFLEKNISKDRISSVSGWPYGYMLTREKIILTPSITGGTLRITYNKRPKRLEKRSAKVTSTVGSPITAINTDGTWASQELSYIGEFDSITIVGANGVIKVANIPISSVGVNVINIPSYTLGSGEAIAAGDYVLASGNAANVPDFDDMVESFLVLHATYQAKYGDSSQWSKAVQDDVASHFGQIKDCFGTLNEDFAHVPIISTDFLSLW